MKWWTGIVIAAALAAVAVLSIRSANGADQPASQSEVTCDVIQPSVALPADVRETSGLARGASGVLWTHNDAGGEPELFGFDRNGRQVAHLAVTGARHIDWEDIEAGPCAAGHCLFIADIGDNDGTREHITIYRVPEPAVDAAEVAATAFHARFPDRPQDAEALVAADGSLYIITKGEHGALGLYRFPAAALADAAGTTVLEHVRELGPQPGRRGDRVTAAAASPDGSRIAIRTYDRLYLHDSAALLASAAAEDGLTFDLRPLNEPQGEAVALDDDGTVWLTTEAESSGDPFLTGLSCPLDG